MMRMTLKQLAQHCAVWQAIAEIDGDHMRAVINYSDGSQGLMWLK